MVLIALTLMDGSEKKNNLFLHLVSCERGWIFAVVFLALAHFSLFSLHLPLSLSLYLSISISFSLSLLYSRYLALFYLFSS